eukprot:g1128.t1
MASVASSASAGDGAGEKRSKRTAKGLLLQYLMFKSLGPSKYHFARMGDGPRWDTYARALARCCRQEAGGNANSAVNIVDVGAGWGMLSVVARRAVRSARRCDSHILKVERLKPIARACLDLLESAADADGEPESSTESTAPSLDEEEEKDAPLRADLVLLDVLAPGLFEPSNTGDLTSGLLSTLRSIRDAGIVSDQTEFMPRSARVFGALLHIPPQPCVPSLSFPLGEVRGVHVSPFNSFRHPPNGFDTVALEAVDGVEYLTEPFVLDADIDFGSLVRGKVSTSAKTTYPQLDPYWVKRLSAFYEKYNPDKMKSVKATLKKYQGYELQLFNALVEKYGEEPEPNEKGEAVQDEGQSRGNSNHAEPTDDCSRDSVCAQNWRTAGLSSSVITSCRKSGRCNAMVMWYELNCGDLGDWTQPSLIISGAPNASSTRRQAVILLDGIDETELVSGAPVYVSLDRGNADDSDNTGQVRYFSVVSGSSAITTAMEKAAQAENEPTSWHNLTQHENNCKKLNSSPSTVSRWHFSMLLDDDRNMKYQKAIEKSVAKLGNDALVLDIGTGTGLLSCFAARAGAKSVIGCEANAPIARVASECVKRNGLENIVKIVRAHSTDLIIGSDEEKSHMRKKADLIVSEILDCGLLGEAVLPVLKHAREHLLAEGGVVIPARARVKGMLIELVDGGVGTAVMTRPPSSVGPLVQDGGRCGDAHQERSIKAGSAFNKFIRTNTWEQIRLRDLSHVALSEPFDMLACDLSGYAGSSAGDGVGRGAAGDREDETSCVLEVPVTRDGKASAVVMWFDLDVDSEGEFVISTGPDNHGSCWSQSVQLLTDPEWPGDLDSTREVRSGSIVRMRTSQDDSRIKVELME